MEDAIESIIETEDVKGVSTQTNDSEQQIEAYSFTKNKFDYELSHRITKSLLLISHYKMTIKNILILLYL